MIHDERRAFSLKDLRIEQRDDAPPKIRGYAAVFGQLSEPLGDFREQIEAGAFMESLADGDQRALWQHDDRFVLGRRSAGTLKLREDDHGLAVEIDPPDTTWAKDALVSIRRGDVREMSFRFRVPPGGDRWERKADTNIRTVLRAALVEVSAVTFPAYAQTDVAVRSLREWEAARAAEWQAEHEYLRRMAELAEIS